MNRSRRLIGALALLTVLGAACGDNDSGTKSQAGKSSATTSSTAPAPTKAEFIAAADAVCAKFVDQMNPIFGALFTGGEPQPAAAQEGFGKVLDLVTQQMKEIRALTPPAGDQDQLNALFAEVDKAIGDTRTRIADPKVAMELLQSDDDPFAATDEKAKAYGFKDCGGEETPETETFGGVELSADEQAKASKVTVEGFEYGYKGVPASLPAGPAIVSFTNIGVEDHEIGIVKVKKGVTAAEAIAKAKVNPEDESFVDNFLGGAYALKGEHTDLSIKLEPGLYGYGCFVKDANDKAHATHGMIGTFTVR
jgi:hypothetical protein